MRKNEIKKKNISANALSDDDLEDVAGGWHSYTNHRLRLSEDEVNKLEAAGYIVRSADRRDHHGSSNIYYVQNEYGGFISPLSLKFILGPEAK